VEGGGGGQEQNTGRSRGMLRSFSFLFLEMAMDRLGWYLIRV